MRNRSENHPNDVEVQKQRALRRLGGGHPVCSHCGEGDPRTLELHHIAGRAYDTLTAPICRNCHRKQPNSLENVKGPADPPIMERIGHLLIGLADFLIALIETLRRFGQELINGAAHCPAPWGSLTPVDVQP